MAQLGAFATAAVARAYDAASTHADDPGAAWVEMRHQWYSPEELRAARDEVRALMARHGHEEARPGDVRCATFWLGARIDG